MFHHLPESTVPTPTELAATTAATLANYREMIAAAEARGDAESVARLQARLCWLQSL